MTAVTYKPWQIVRILLDAQADPNLITQGLTSLDLACIRNDEMIVRMLLQAGAKLVSPNSLQHCSPEIIDWINR